MTFISTGSNLPDGRFVDQATFLSDDAYEQKRFLEILHPGIQTNFVGGWGLGYAINDERAYFSDDPEKDDFPRWIVIVPIASDPRSRIVVRAFEIELDHPFLEVYLEGDCDTTERREALIVFGFDQLDETPVLPPADKPLLSMHVPPTD
ncbi:MAG: hypothetical protein UZ21_OP11001000898 [Microgenomates bacterium OLB22]|nr:MAG: hypothetical protein UZ21_OP11001000898 [Microgenomates bacterium OLB22]